MPQQKSAQSIEPLLPPGELRTLSVAELLPDVARHLHRAGAVLVRLEYDGRTGTGRFAILRCFDSLQREMSVDLPSTLHAQLLRIFRTVLESRYPTWAQREGACGDFDWNLLLDSVAHIHRVRFVGYETQRHHGL